MNLRMRLWILRHTEVTMEASIINGIDHRPGLHNDILYIQAYVTNFDIRPWTVNLHI